MGYVDHRQEPSLSPLIVIVVVIVVASIYIIISSLSGDPLWFNRQFEATPSSIIVHCYGKSITIAPQSDQFSGITQLVNQTLSGRKRWDSLTLSDETYQDYQTRTDAVVVELYYPEPLRIHTNTRLYSHVSNIIIPLEGRHANTNPVFGRHRGLSTGGSLHVESTDALRDYLAEQDICPRRQD